MRPTVDTDTVRLWLRLWVDGVTPIERQLAESNLRALGAALVAEERAHTKPRLAVVREPGVEW